MAVEPQNIPAWRIAVLGAASVLFLVVVILGVTAWYTFERDLEAQRKTDAAVNAPLLDLQSAQLLNLNNPRWVDRQKQIVAIPIDHAMKKLVAQGLPQLPDPATSTAPSKAVP